MKTKNRINVAPEYVEFILDESIMVEGVIYISKECGVAIHLCLCGCKSQVVTPTGKDWWTITGDEVISITPSIGNYNLTCNSHYVITNNVANIL